MAQSFSPTPFGPYMLVAPLGQGGMAEVFLAVRKGPMGFRKELAIKRIRRDITAGDERLNRHLINEARVGGYLRHPNIVDVYEFGTVEEQPYIAMEYVHGLTLRALMRGADQRGVRLPRGAVLDAAIQVCDGLHYAHNLRTPEGDHASLVHRDLKPSNILVSTAGQAKIMDFGIARSSLRLYHTNTEGIPKGTLRYMAPEQLDDPSGLDHRVDLFALGAILFEAFTGEMLVDPDDPRAAMWMLVSGAYRERLAALDKAFPELAPAIRRSLDLDRSVRYADAQAFGSELRTLREQSGIRNGCRELMHVIGAVRDGSEPGVLTGTAGTSITGSSFDEDWSEFIASLQARAEETSDPYVVGMLPSGDLETLRSRLEVGKPESDPTARWSGEAAKFEPTVVDELSATTVVAPRRSSPLPWILAVAACVAAVVLVIWGPRSLRVGGQDPAPGEDPVTAAAPAVEEPAAAEPATAEEPAPTPGEVIAETPPEPTPAAAEAEPAAEEATPEAVAADAPRVRVVVNSDPWSRWELRGDAEGQGAHTPYVGELPPGTYRFVLTHPATGAVHEHVVVVHGGEPEIVHCWSFTTGGPC